MGANITVDKFEKWMQKNYWTIKRTNKHVTWIFEPKDCEGKRITYNIITLNHHRTKGQGIGQGTLLRVAKVMKIPKNNLIDLIRTNTEYKVPKTINNNSKLKQKSLKNITEN